MLIHSVFLSCLVTCVLTTAAAYFDGGQNGDFQNTKSLWLSGNSGKLMLSKRQAPIAAGQSNSTSPLEDAPTNVTVNEKGLLQVSEGGTEHAKPPTVAESASNKTIVAPGPTSKPEPNKVNATSIVSQNASSFLSPSAEKPSNSTIPKAPSYQADLSNPGVMKRGLIVFGGFALVAIAYLIFYRRNTKNMMDSNNTHGTNDSNQFRYGVLQSDDRRDNLELSRILTVESDEDEDEDLEIFDLEQKKKSLSYVNLQTNDDYVVHGSRDNLTDRDNLLLDIEDANSDTLINWSSNGNKSVL